MEKIVFSYGSNSFLPRIVKRVGKIEVLGTRQLVGYKLTFNKKSQDGSSKANLVPSNDPRDIAWGVLHKMSTEAKRVLDEYEGLGIGYDEAYFDIQLDNKTQRVSFYVAQESKYLCTDKPYNWYLNYVIAGSLQNQFPQYYLKNLQQVQSKPDPDPIRSLQNKIYV